MSGDFLVTAARLRREAGIAPDAPVDPEDVLLHLYSADCVRLSELTVTGLRDWLERGASRRPPA